jgi:hypothetical protein
VIEKFSNFDEGPIMTTQAVDEEELLVHTWRVARLTQLGISRAVAEVEAGPPRLAPGRPAGPARLPPAAGHAHRL